MGHDLNEIYRLSTDRQAETISASRQEGGIESGAYEPTKKLIRKIARGFELEVEFDDDPSEDEGVIEITE